jgi:hypothetical protein
MTNALRTSVLVIAALGAACSSRSGAPDGGMRFDGGGGGDSAVADTGAPDAGAPDTGAPDAGPADGGEVMCEDLGDDVPYADRTTNEEFTDPGDCPTCPGAFTGLEELEVGTLTPGMTSVTISGAALGATGCEWYVLGGECGVTRGRIATDPDGTGMFEVTVPVFCGDNVVQLVCDGAGGRRVYVRRLAGEACNRDLRLTLSWDAVGDDLELHLIREGGTINSDTDDCTWFTCISSSPDWGVAGDPTDDPRKDIDDLDDFGPENIYLENAADGTYHVMVEHWGTLGSPSDAAVDVAIGETTVARVEETALQTHWIWYVGTVTFPAGTFTPIDTLTDCSAATDWNAGGSLGCGLAIP